MYSQKLFIRYIITKKRMNEKGLISFFEKYLDKPMIFRNKTVLQSNYAPSQILHRNEQISFLANVFAPALRCEKPSNIFIYGKTGTGKTLTVKYIMDHLKIVASQKGVSVKVIYLNCKLKKVADTEYRLIAQLLKDYGKSVPATGLPTDEVYNCFFAVLDSKKHILLLVLDEIDQLVGRAGNELLYNLTRINSELKNTQIALIGIANDLKFTESLDPRVKSSLSEEEIDFHPYNAAQIQDILQYRAQLAFGPGVLEEGLLEKCAAFAAREHGDARRALELLRVSGEIAERHNESKVLILHLDQAEEKIERDRILDVVSTQPKQCQLVLFSILRACSGKKGVFTGELYSLYEHYCVQAGFRPLTQRRVSDIIAELDMLGIINAQIVSKGRYGRTREISICLNDTLVLKMRGILSGELGLLWNS